MSISNLKVRFSDFAKIYEKKNKCLIANIDNGKCIMISTEVMNIYKQAENKGLSFSELISCIGDEKSKTVLSEITQKLDKLSMWKHNEIENEKHRKSRISLDITNQCNLSCKHCCVSAGDNARGQELTTEELCEIIERMICFNPENISISGGEPMVRNDFRLLTDKIRSIYI